MYELLKLLGVYTGSPSSSVLLFCSHHIRFLFRMNLKQTHFSFSFSSIIFKQEQHMMRETLNYLLKVLVFEIIFETRI